MSQFEAQREQIKEKGGFIAALDQSGGSTPKALAQYGVPEDSYSGEEEMFAEIHKMRSRIITAPDFNNKKVIGAILFERTMNGQIDGKDVGDVLWDDFGVVPFLKVDKGLADQKDDVQLMKPMPELASLLEQAKVKGMFGTKMRSVIHEANSSGITAVVAQQFEVARQIAAAGLIPIIEPEVNIQSKTKAEAEELLKSDIERHLEALPEDVTVMLKLTIPTEAGLYDTLADHPRVLRVVALSGGYSTDHASELLSKNKKMIASFSRALTEGLSAQQDEKAFNKALGANIDKIYQASV